MQSEETDCDNVKINVVDLRDKTIAHDSVTVTTTQVFKSDHLATFRCMPASTQLN